MRFDIRVDTFSRHTGRYNKLSVSLSFCMSVSVVVRVFSGTTCSSAVLKRLDERHFVLCWCMGFVSSERTGSFMHLSFFFQLRMSFCMSSSLSMDLSFRMHVFLYLLRFSWMSVSPSLFYLHLHLYIYCFFLSLLLQSPEHAFPSVCMPFRMYMYVYLCICTCVCMDTIFSCTVSCQPVYYSVCMFLNDLYIIYYIHACMYIFL